MSFFKKKEKMVPCLKCGQNNPENSTFCNFCGASLSDQQDTQAKVQEVKEITDDLKDKRGFWSKVIPGYRGYKKRELRRESDKLLRDYLVKTLTNTKSTLNGIQEEIASEVPAALKTSEDLLTELDTFLRKIRNADYGYSGIFDSIKIKVDHLDKLLEFDQGIVEVVLEIEDNVKRFNDDPTNDTHSKIKELRNMIRQAIKLYSQREDFMVGFSVEK
jgi:hypothetical protein